MREEDDFDDDDEIEGHADDVDRAMSNDEDEDGDEGIEVEPGED